MYCVSGQKIDVEISQFVGRVATARKQCFQLVRLFLGVDALQQAQHRSDLAHADAIIVQELGIDILLYAGFILARDRQHPVNDSARRLAHRQIRPQIERRPQCVVSGWRFLLS